MSKRKSSSDSNVDKKKKRSTGPETISVAMNSAVSSAKDGGAAVLSAASGVGSMIAAKSPKLSIPSAKSLGAGNLTRGQMITGFASLLAVIVAILIIENKLPKLVGTIQDILALGIAFGGIPLVFLLNRLWGRMLLWPILGKTNTDTASSMINNAAFAMCAVTVSRRFSAIFVDITHDPSALLVLHNVAACFLSGLLAGMNCAELDKFRLVFFAILSHIPAFAALKLGVLWCLPLGVLLGAVCFHAGHKIGAKIPVNVSMFAQHLSLVCMAVSCLHVYRNHSLSWDCLFAIIAVYVSTLLTANDAPGLGFCSPNVVSMVVYVGGKLLCRYAASAASASCGALTNSFLLVFPSAVSSFTDLAIAAHSFLAQHPLTMGVFGGTSGTKPALSELIPRLFTVFVFGVLGGVTLMILG